MKSILFFTVIMTGVLILSGCPEPISPMPTTIPTPAPIPIPTPVNTSTPMSTPTPGSTLTPIPTSTPVPTLTPTPTLTATTTPTPTLVPTLTPTPVPTLTPTPTLTPHPYSNETKLEASDGAALDRFGHSVSLSQDGNTAVVGAYLDDDKGSDSGAFYIYKWNGISWDETKLTASDGADDDLYGSSVVISKDSNTIAVGAPYDDDKGYDSGSVYIYTWNGISWDETKLTASDGDHYDHYGKSVALSETGNIVAVGCTGDDDRGSASGSVYIYEWNGTIWDETKITASDGMDSDSFGFSVSLSQNGNTLLVGAIRDDDRGTDSGSAYIYTYNGTTWDGTKFTDSGGNVYNHFGYSLSLSYDGTTAAIGSYREEPFYLHYGSVHIYEWNGTTWDVTKLTSSGNEYDDWFGCSVSLSEYGNTVVVGAHEDNDNGGFAGSAYIYKWNGSTWDEIKITASDGGDDDHFGYSVSISQDGNILFIGADNDDGWYPGAAYILEN